MPDSQVTVYRDTFLSRAHLSDKQRVKKHNRTWTFTRTCGYRTDRSLRYSPVINAAISGNNASFMGVFRDFETGPGTLPDRLLSGCGRRKDAARRLTAAMAIQVSVIWR
jgi:hypothetical protein